MWIVQYHSNTSTTTYLPDLALLDDASFTTSISSSLSTSSEPLDGVLGVLRSDIIYLYSKQANLCSLVLVSTMSIHFAIINKGVVKIKYM